MKLHSDYPFWMISDGIQNTFPTLHEDARTDVVVIGGGITGALVSHALCKAGIAVYLVEKRHVGHGSTAASTALLQYEIDTPLFELIRKFGERPAVRSYKLCLEALHKLEKLCGTFPGKAGFERHPSLLYASYAKHVATILHPEYAARRAHGFKVDLLDATAIADKFGFTAPGALLSAQAAHVNPYLLTNYLLREVVRMGGRIHDLTEVSAITPSTRGVTVHTANGCTLSAKHAIVAAGYEADFFLPRKIGTINSTYAVVSKPLPEKQQWYKNALIWETRTPYHYFRTTADRRIIIGGRDAPFYSPEKRDNLIPRKTRELLADFHRLFPRIPFEPDFWWAGAFNETKDGLPYIGPCEHKRVLYAMGYGGNGITFSVIAADILRDLVLGKKSADAAIFGFNR